MAAAEYSIKVYRRKPVLDDQFPDGFVIIGWGWLLRVDLWGAPLNDCLAVMHPVVTVEGLSKTRWMVRLVRHSDGRLFTSIARRVDTLSWAVKMAMLGKAADTHSGWAVTPSKVTDATPDGPLWLPW